MQASVRLSERKIVTILFADIQGSMALTAELDPEQIDEIFSRTIGKMRQAVNRYGGIVNRAAGDGIMAMFGAPLASEHHAQQACHAALAILKDAQDEGTEGSDPIRVRVGVHSGEVVVRDLIGDMATHYEAMGQAVSIAARMEQMASAGHALLSPETKRLAGDAIRTQSLGLQTVKGVAQPLELFELVAISADRDRVHSLSPNAGLFVGRETEVDLLTRALSDAVAGNGGVVVVRGEAGSGKTRLIEEFLRRSQPIQPVVVRGYTRSFGQRGYQLIIGILERWFGISVADSAEEVQEKIKAGVAAALFSPSLGSHQPATVQALLALFDLAAADSSWLALDPVERRNRIASAVCELFRHAFEGVPLIVVAEDLHWADSDSLHVLGKLAGTARAGRMLLLMTLRDDDKSVGTDLFGAAHCNLRSLNHHEARDLLRGYLIASEDMSTFEESLIAHTGGNPLFIEECLYSLSETGHLQREGARFRYTKPLGYLGLPTTIRALISARVDRLAPAEKDTLEAAAVIGLAVRRDVLVSVAAQDNAVLDRTLESLCKARFLGLGDPQTNTNEYRFHHSLTREAVYHGILLRHRRDMHGKVVAAIEWLDRPRILEYAEALAAHSKRAEDWPRATHYLRQSAKKAVARSSNRAAVDFLNDALVTVERLIEGRQKTLALVDVLMELRYPLFKLGDLSGVSRVLARAGAIVVTLDDHRRLSLLHAYQSHLAWMVGDSLSALKEARASSKVAELIPDRSLAVRARFQEGMVLTNRGEYAEGLAAISELLDHITAGFGAGTYPDASMATIAHSYMARAFAEIGDFDQARRHAEASHELAEVIADPFSQVFAAMAIGFVRLSLGEHEVAIMWLERSRQSAIQAETEYLLALPAGFLGMAYVAAGQAERAVSLLEEAISHANSIGFFGNQPYRLAALGRAYFAMGRIDDALNMATDALRQACTRGEIYAQAIALHVLAEATHRSSPRDSQGYLDSALELSERYGLAPVNHP